MRAPAIFAAFAVGAAQYQPNWQSLDARPLPSWYDDAKFGIFIHWGVFSVPSWGVPYGGASGEWFWWNWQGAQDANYISFMNANYPPSFTYPDFIPSFTAELFDPMAWATLFKASGAKYVVLTSKHHEGFCNWNATMCWPWDSVSAGPHRDLVGELTTAVRAQNLTMGLYHSLFEWFNPKYLADKASGFNTTDFAAKTIAELKEIVSLYEPSLLWSDGDWEAPDTYWGSCDFLAWLYNSSPVKDVVVVNDRWGAGDICTHGGYYTCNDRYNPGKLQNHKWENAFTVDTASWGYRRNMQLAQVMTVPAILAQIVSTVACGGNALLNIGPARDGSIDPIFQDRLLGVGAWLGVNGEAIYATQPWRAQNETAVSVWYTSTAAAVYAIALEWPTNNELTLSIPVTTGSTSVTMLGYAPGVTWKSGGASGVSISIPDASPAPLPSAYAWVFKLTGVN